MKSKSVPIQNFKHWNNVYAEWNVCDVKKWEDTWHAVFGAWILKNTHNENIASNYKNIKTEKFVDHNDVFEHSLILTLSLCEIWKL